MQNQKDIPEYEDVFIRVIRLFAARGRAIREQRSLETEQLLQDLALGAQEPGDEQVYETDISLPDNQI